MAPILLGREDQLSSIIRYADQEAYLLARFLAVACYRLEYCLRALEALPPELRQVAVYGTRSMQPLPLSRYNAQALGTSAFGRPLLAQYEAATGRAAPRGVSEAFALLVSYRVLNGHQPYAPLNTADPSVNDCRCQQVTCPFCGGVGAGYNGGLSGNVNARVVSGGFADMGPDLANGYADGEAGGRAPYGYGARELGLGGGFLPFHGQPQRVSMYERTAPAVPHCAGEGPAPAAAEPEPEPRRGRRGAGASTRESSAEPEAADVAAQLDALGRAAGDAMPALHFGARLADTALLPPPPDCCTEAQLRGSQNPFARAYLALGHECGAVARPAGPPLPQDQAQLLGAERQQVLYDGVAQTMLMDRIGALDELGVGAEAAVRFQNRGVLLGMEQLRRDDTRQNLQRLYQLLLTGQPAGGAARDEYVQDRAYALLGSHAYPLLSLRRLLQNVYKRLDGAAAKLVSQHADVASAQLFRSAKCSPANCLTNALLMHAARAELRGQDAALLPLSASAVAAVRDAGAELYLVETVAGFANFQSLNLERK